MIKTILVATDGSAHARKALAVAGDLAKNTGARLVILHALLRDAGSKTLRGLATRSQLSKEMRKLLDNYEVDAELEMAEAGLEPVPLFTPAPLELLNAIGAQLLVKAQEIARKAGAKKITVQLAGGEPADAILKAAKKQKADMIVLGTRGLGDFKGLLLGSVSHKVSSRASCAVMTVK